MIKNTFTAYGRIAKIFHWLMAMLFIAMFIIAYIMIHVPKSDFMYSLYNFHKATGILLFSLVALRLTWRFFNIQPSFPSSMPIWQRIAAHGNILLLYLLMFLMPLTGFLTSTLGSHDISIYGILIIKPLAHNTSLSDFFSQAHEILSYILLITFSLHLIASLYHHYFLKDAVLNRMLPNLNANK